MSKQVLKLFGGIGRSSGLKGFGRKFRWKRGFRFLQRALKYIDKGEDSTLYTLEKIRSAIKTVIDKEKLDEKETERFFSILRSIANEVLDPVQELQSVTPVPNDLDTLIRAKIKENKVADTRISISRFFEWGLGEALDTKDYYTLRNELLQHSKIIKEDSKSLDFLLVEVENVGKS